MFLLDLSNVQICYMESILLPYPFLYLSVCFFRFRTGQILLIHIYRDLNMLLRIRKFGQKYARLDVVFFYNKKQLLNVRFLVSLRLKYGIFIRKYFPANCKFQLLPVRKML